MDDVTSRSSPELDPLLAPPTRSRKGAVLVGVLLLALVLVWFWARGSAEPNAVAYQEVAVERGDIEASVTATGTLSALVTVDVGSQISGRIQALYADFNSRVEAGQRIAKIDPALFEAAVERAQANVAAAEASIKRAEVQAADARRQAERTETLITRGLIARSERDTAATAAAAAEADLTAARASALQARASLREARANLEYTDILSPTEGVVISRSVNVGQTVAASLQAPVLFTIAQDLRQMQVNTSVAEADIGRLRDGMAVYFTVDAYPGERFEGQVRQIRNAATVNLNVVTYDAVIDVDNPALKLKPGMTANVRFIIDARDDVLRVPAAALRFRPASGETPRPVRVPDGASSSDRSASRGDAVWVLREGRPQRVPVNTGLSDGLHVELTGNELAEGDRVITGTAGAQDSGSGGARRFRML